MKGIIIYNRSDYEKNYFFVEKSKEYMDEHQVELKLLFAEDIRFATGIDESIASNEYVISPNNKPDFAVVRCINPKLSKMLEMYDIKVFNNSKISEIANHKYFAYLLAQNCKIKTIPTIYCPLKITKDDLYNAFEQFNCNEIIAKTVAGHGGSEVFCLNKENINEIICNIKKQKLWDKKYVIQPRIQGMAKDVRVYILDNKPVSAILRCSPCDYRSNYSLGGEVKEISLDNKLHDLINTLTQTIYMDYAGVDFIIDEHNQYYFNEIEDVVGARMLYKCTEIDIISRFMSHIIDKVSEKTI